MSFYQIFEKIFISLSTKDRLNCRLVSSTLLQIIDILYTNKLTVHINDDHYKSCSSTISFNFKPCFLEAGELILTKLSPGLISRNFSCVRSLAMTSCITHKNFHRLIQNLPALHTLKINSMVLGGTFVQNDFLICVCLQLVLLDF
jgi:hypothetical protein